MMSLHVSYIVPSFPVGTLTTSDFRLLSNSDWDLPQLEFFTSERPWQKGKALDPPPYVFKKMQSKPRAACAWVIESIKEDRPIAWVELHCFHRLIETYFLGISTARHGWTWDSKLNKALSLLISAIFIRTGCQRIQVFASGNASNQVGNLGWGEKSITKQLVREPIFSKSKQALEDCAIIAVNEMEWWDLENAQSDQKSLAYLIKRMYEPRSKRKRKPGLFELLTRRFKKKNTAAKD